VSRGPGTAQRFILAQLTALEDGEWMPVAELIEQYAKLKGEPVNESIDRSLRNAYRRLANPMEPKVELKWINKRLQVRLTWRGRAYQTNPWKIKEREMSTVWQAVQAEQLRGPRRRK
jgi:hypothetical protein